MDLLIRGLTSKAHRYLKSRAERNHRSVVKEARAILEGQAGLPTLEDLGPPIPVKRPMSWDEISAAKKEGRS